MVIDNDELDRFSLADGQLAVRASEGDTQAFETLYRRHAAAAWRVAQAVAGNTHDAADAVSEAFTRLLAAMAQGRVASSAPFRPYLLVTTRNAAIDTLRRRRRVQPADLEIDLREVAGSGTAGPPEQLVDSVDAALVAAAFRDLPERWRSVLWLTEVEGMPAREVGQHLGLTPNGVAQLALRARNGLRERFLQAHLNDSDDTCQQTVSQLGAYAASALGPRAVAKVDQHLAGCPVCRSRLAELEDVESGLRRVLLPLPVALAPAALAHFRTSLVSASQPVHSWLLGGSRGVRMASRLSPPLSTAAAGLLALGVITAAVMGDTAGLPPVTASRPGALAPTGGGGIATLTPAATITAGGLPGAAVPGQGAAIPTPGAALGGPNTLPPAPPGPTSGPGSPSPAPPSPPPTASPVVQVAAAANLGVTAVSASVGVGGCTGASVAGSPSCAPAAPSQPGLKVIITSPQGSITTSRWHLGRF